MICYRVGGYPIEHFGVGADEVKLGRKKGRQVQRGDCICVPMRNDTTLSFLRRSVPVSPRWFEEETLSWYRVSPCLVLLFFRVTYLCRCTNVRMVRHSYRLIGRLPI